MVLIDDFEDGDTTTEVYTGWTGTITTTTDTLYETYSGRIASTNETSDATVSDIGDKAADLSVSIRINQDSGDSFDRAAIRVSSDGSVPIILRHYHGTQEVELNGTTIGSWSPGTVYDYELQCDWAANTVTVVRNGSTLASDVDFRASAPGLGAVTVRNQTTESGTTYTVDIDEVSHTGPPAAPDDVQTDIEDDDTVTATWGADTSGGEIEEFEVELSTDGGPWARVADITDGSTTHTESVDTAVDTVQYRVRAKNSAGASDWTTSATISTNIQSPDTGTLDATSAELTWGGADQHDGVAIYQASESGSSLEDYTRVATSSAGVDAYTVTGLSDSAPYYFRLVPTYDGADGTDGPPSAELVVTPTVTGLSLGNGVEDEISVSFDAVIDSGDYRVQVRETGASSWDSSATGWAEAVLDAGTTSTTITGREDGEEYEIRARTEQGGRVGPWLEPQSITTKFPGATNVQITAGDETSVAGEATDNADNEDGFDIERREQFRDGWGEWRTVDSLGPNSGTGTIQWSDNNALPDTTYQYRVRAYTEHSTATSDSVQTTTADDGVGTDRVGAQGWDVVLERDDGVTISPTIVGEPTINRKLNDLPTCEIPVAQHERWRSDDWGGAEMRVYHDGQRQPIEELRRPRDDPGQTTLIGRGGVELEERVTLDVIEREAHLVADDVVQQASSYQPNVDDPAGDPSADVLQEAVDSQSEWLDAVGSAADQPWTVRDDGSIEGLQTAGFYEAEGSDVTQYISDGELTTSDDGRWSGGAVERITDYERNNTLSGFSVSFTTEHDIPLSEFGVAVRVHYTGSGDHHAYTAEVDGTAIGVAGEPLNITNSEAQWILTVNSNLSGTLSAGEHTLSIRASEEATNVDDPGANWDGLAWYDARYGPGFTENVTDDVIEGPDEYPEVPVETADIVTVRQVIGGRLDITSARDAAQLELSNDNGVSWPISATDASTVEGQFSEGSDTLRARITLSGYDSDPTTSPAGRTAPQSVDGYELFADLDDTPLLVNRSYDASAIEILQDIADYADAIGELTWDEAAGSIAVEWTQPGQRTANVDPDLVDYSVETDYGSVHRKAVIKGTLVPIEGEIVGADHSSPSNLNEDYLEETGEFVRSKSDDIQYERGVDYELYPNSGELQTLSTGAISDGEDLVVDYRYHITGSYESPDYDGTYPVLVESLPAVTTERNAEQAALIAVKTASEPITKASVTIGDLPPGVNLVDALSLDGLPTDEPLEQWSVDNSPRETTVQLGTRDPVEETLGRLNSRLAAVSRKV